MVPGDLVPGNHWVGSNHVPHHIWGCFCAGLILSVTLEGGRGWSTREWGCLPSAGAANLSGWRAVALPSSSHDTLEAAVVGSTGHSSTPEAGTGFFDMKTDERLHFPPAAE